MPSFLTTLAIPPLLSNSTLSSIKAVMIQPLYSYWQLCIMAIFSVSSHVVIFSALVIFSQRSIYGVQLHLDSCSLICIYECNFSQPQNSTVKDSFSEKLNHHLDLAFIPVNMGIINTLWAGWVNISLCHTTEFYTFYIKVVAEKMKNGLTSSLHSLPVFYCTQLVQVFTV